MGDTIEVRRGGYTKREERGIWERREEGDTEEERRGKYNTEEGCIYVCIYVCKYVALSCMCV